MGKINYGLLTSTVGFASMVVGLTISAPYMVICGTIGGGICLLVGIEEGKIIRAQEREDLKERIRQDMEANKRP